MLSFIADHPDFSASFLR